MYGDEIPRDHRGRFRRGKPGGPGRPYGSLTRINAPLGFLRDAVANWERYGEAALTHLIQTDPVRYFLLMVAIETGEFRVRRAAKALCPIGVSSSVSASGLASGPARDRQASRLFAFCFGSRSPFPR